MPHRVAEVRLDPFDPERDASLLSTWLRAPHVSRWWGDPVKTLHDVLERPHGGGDALVVADGVPVGYLRWQMPTRAELDAAGLHEVSEATTMDIDIAIGAPDYVGRGVGPRALGLLVRDLAADRRLRTIILATSVDNLAALSAFARAGFERRRTFDDPESGPCWLFARDVRPD